jgi:hypothetical protein
MLYFASVITLLVEETNRYYHQYLKVPGKLSFLCLIISNTVGGINVAKSTAGYRLALFYPNQIPRYDTAIIFTQKFQEKR